MGKWFSLGGFHGTPPPPLCTNGSAGYLMQLSVNVVSWAEQDLFYEYACVLEPHPSACEVPNVLKWVKEILQEIFVKKVLSVELLLIQVFVKIYVQLHKCIIAIFWTRPVDRLALQMHIQPVIGSGGWVTFDMLVQRLNTLNYLKQSVTE